ncbi:MAG: hypothetical protein ABI837_16875, partial [Acidobacteriota bacterium]
MPETNDVVPEQSLRLKRTRLVLMSFGLTLSAFVMAVSLLVYSGATADAATYSSTGSPGASPSWASAVTWNCTATGPGSTGCGAYPGDPAAPGAAPGDLALISWFGPGSLTVNSPIANAVTIASMFSNPATPLDITTNGSLQLQASNALNSGSGSLLVVSGGSLIVRPAATVSTDQVRVTSGSITNNGTITLGNTFTFDGGTLNGIGTLNLNGKTLAATAANGPITIDGGQLVDATASTINYQPAGTNTLFLENNSRIKLGAGSQLLLPNNNTLDSVSRKGVIDILPGGLLRKSGGSSQSIVNAIVNNGGTVDYAAVGVGLIDLANGGTHTGLFATGGVAIEFDSTPALGNPPHIFNTGATFNASDSVELLGGTFTANTPLTMAFFSQLGGLLNGSGDVSTTSAFSWSAGTQSGSGKTILSSGSGNFSGSTGNMTLDGRELDIIGPTLLTYSASSNFLSLDNGAHIENSGQIYCSNNAQIASNAPATSSINTFGAAGEFAKGVTITGTTDVFPHMTFLNGGQLAADTAGDIIRLHNGADFGGIPPAILSTVVGSELDFNGGIFNFNGTSMTGMLGNLHISGTGSLFGNGNIQAATVQNDGTINPGTSPGMFNITGNYNQGPAGILNME